MSGIMSMLLGAVSSAASAVDEFFNRVTLLLPGNGTNGAQNNTFLDSSTNNFTITRNGNTTQGTFSPFSQTGWSNHFNGATTSGPFISASYSTTNFDWFTSGQDFTLECWVFPADLATFSYSDGTNIIPRLTGNADVGGTINYWSFGPISDGKVRLHYFNGATVQVTSTSTVTANTWNHIAFTKTSSGIIIFVNGTATTATAVSGTPQSSASYPLVIGRVNNASINGYVSNYRILKNVTPPYSGSYTVPTLPLTDISGTKILTAQANRFIDSSSVANALTVSGSTISVQAFEPFAPGVEYSAATVGGSGYFDGTGDNLVAPNNTALAMGTGDFQIEFWAYHTSIPAGFTYIDTRPTGTNGSYITLGYNNSGNGIFLYVNTMLISTGITPVANSWTHFVLSRVGSTTRLFRNGSQIGSATDGTNYAIGAQGMGIGGNTIAADNYFPGYISGFRVVKGSGVTSVTVPTAPPTAITNTSLLLNFTNAGITDATAKNDLETVGNAQISTTQSKFGGSSMYFDGTGDYLKFPSSELVPFASNEKFTIEGWIYPSVATAGQIYGIYTTRNSGISAYAIAITLFGSPLKINVEIATSGSSLVTISSSTTISANTWYHFAVVHDGTQLKLYLNGTSEGTPATTSQATTLKVMALGRYYVDIDNYYFNGYIDDFRITKGYARYTSNFTPPTAAYALQ